MNTISKKMSGVKLEASSSETSYEINRILAFNEATNEYTIEWNDKSISNEPSANVSQAAIDAFNIINKHNVQVMQNCQQQGIQPSAQKAYIMIRCSVSKESSVETQRLALLNFCLQNNILIDYYSVDSGVSGRYNNKTNTMNNLNYEFGYRIKTLTDKNILVINSIDRLGRHAQTMTDIIQNLMSRNIIICVLDIETIITPDNYKTRDMHMKIYELCYRAQELSDEISKRVKNSIKIRKSLPMNVQIKMRKNKSLLYNQKFVELTIQTFKKHKKNIKLTDNQKYSNTFATIIDYQHSNKDNLSFLKPLKITKQIITKIIKNYL